MTAWQSSPDQDCGSKGVGSSDAIQSSVLSHMMGGHGSGHVGVRRCQLRHHLSMGLAHLCTTDKYLLLCIIRMVVHRGSHYQGHAHASRAIPWEWARHTCFEQSKCTK